MDDYNDFFPGANKEEVLRAASSQSIRAKPVDTIADLLWTYRVDELRTMAQGFGLRRLSKLNKSELVSAICACMDEPRDQLIEYVQSLGTGFLDDMRALCDAGGRIEVRKSEMSSLDQIILPHPPYSMLFDWDEVLYCIMPKETLAKLQGVDWDSMLQVASAIDDAVDFLDLAVDLRGIANLGDTIAEYRARTPGAASEEAIEKAVLRGAMGKKTCFVPMELLDECCLVHGLLAEESGKGREGADAIVDVYMGQEDMPPRPVSDELIEAGGVTEQVLMSGHVDEFAQHVATHVAADVDLQSFLPVAMIAVVGALRCSHDLCDLLDVLQYVGYCPKDSDADELARSYAMLMAHVPRWDRNGWSWSEEACGKVGATDGAEVLQFVPQERASSTSPGGAPGGEVVSFFRRKQ